MDVGMGVKGWVHVCTERADMGVDTVDWHGCERALCGHSEWS